MKVIPVCPKIILPHIKNILFVAPLLLASFNYDMAFAVTYQIPVDVNFTFNSTATLSISGDLVIENLTPGNSSDSNIITISASSNNIVGYDIEATVGDSTNNYTDLRISSSDSTNVFTSLTSNVSALNSFSNDKWGYSYSTDNGTTWISGNTGSTNTGYNGLPLYTGTGVKLADTSSAGSSTIKFKIGAKASDARASGDYTNVINFQMTSKILTTNYTLNYLPNDGNNGQDVTNMPNPATVSNTITQNTNYTLSSSTPARDGYTFAGWCDGTVSNETCSGTTYQPGDTYIIRNTGGNSTINLNAMWEEQVIYYDLTVVFDDIPSTASVTFQNSILGDETVTTSGSTVSLAGGKTYMLTVTATGTVCEINTLSYGQNVTINNLRRGDTFLKAKIVISDDDELTVIQEVNGAPCPTTYTVSASDFDYFSGDGEYWAGDIVEIECSFVPFCKMSLSNPLTSGLAKNGVPVGDAATCTTNNNDGNGGLQYLTTRCTYSFEMPESNVVFTHCYSTSGGGGGGNQY